MTVFPLGDDFVKALGFAHQWHRGQYRKGTSTPYVAHLLGVAAVALEFGASEPEAIAALLHDALEDGPENLEPDVTKRAAVREALQARILREFGPEVEHLVRGATEETPLVGGQKASWEARKSDYLRRLIRSEAPESASSLLVSASDKLHNARSILTDLLTAGESLDVRAAWFSRFRRGQQGTLQYYRLLVDAYRAAPAAQAHAQLQALIAELDRTVTALEAACGVDTATVRAWPLLSEVARAMGGPR
ncbi:HD domain-containing protein [Deinococcus navajonensis]|uniref:HD domain-containing protein n=1 Tax=Deinococcus navajonensis TaxID=309884 RepID=A0ABV8XNF2_9DEIO